MIVSSLISAHHRRTGRERAEVCQGPERQPRRPEVHRVRRPAPPPVHHRFLPGAGEFEIQNPISPPLGYGNPDQGYFYWGKFTR